MAKKQRLEVTVKDTVDYVYDMLIQHPDGCEFSAKSLGGNKIRVVAILCQRGIVEKTRFYTKNGIRCKYKWAVASKPTKVLYGSITQELRDRQKQWNKTFAEKKRAEKNVQCPAVPDEVDIIHEAPLTPVKKEEEKPLNERPEIEANPTPAPLSVDDKIQRVKELWNEIVSLGGYMDGNGHLSIIATIQIF